MADRGVDMVETEDEDVLSDEEVHRLEVNSVIYEEPLQGMSMSLGKRR